MHGRGRDWRVLYFSVIKWMVSEKAVFCLAHSDCYGLYVCWLALSGIACFVVVPLRKMYHGFPLVHWNTFDPSKQCAKVHDQNIATPRM